MRKLLIAVVAAVVAALSVAGIAYAVNTYEVDIAAGSPDKAGSARKPVPSSLNFGYKVGDTRESAAVGDRPVLHRGGGDQVFPEVASDLHVRAGRRVAVLQLEVQGGRARQRLDRERVRRVDRSLGEGAAAM